MKGARVIKYLVFMFIFIYPNVSLAKDNYFKSMNIRKTEFKINKITTIDSMVILDNNQKQIIKKIFNETKIKFYKYFNISRCGLGPLKVIIVTSHLELDNRLYFPSENVYADAPGEGNKIIFGRYFRQANTLYIVPPDFKKYYWKDNFAHEPLHYFFDECKMGNRDVDWEHTQIEEFLR